MTLPLPKQQVPASANRADPAKESLPRVPARNPGLPGAPGQTGRVSAENAGGLPAPRTPGTAGITGGHGTAGAAGVPGSHGTGAAWMTGARGAVGTAGRTGTAGTAFSPPRPLFKTPSSGGGAAAKPALPGSGAASQGFNKNLQINNEEFVQFRDFIYTQCGIYISETRKYLLETRLTGRIRELNLKSFAEYLRFLHFDASRRTELGRLFELVTTNETSFYRNPPQLKTFQEVVLKSVLDECRKKGQNRLRIWSAGCSSGEEPYTLAMILHEVLKAEISRWDIRITANDLSEAVLGIARRGVYSEYALRTTPPEIIQKYFEKDGSTYTVAPAVKRLVSFGQINLNDAGQVGRVEKSHIVFCRNVIIYFDDDMKKRVISAFYDNLLPEGRLLIGHSESLHNITRAFTPEYHPGTIVYRKTS